MRAEQGSGEEAQGQGRFGNITAEPVPEQLPEELVQEVVWLVDRTLEKNETHPSRQEQTIDLGAGPSLQADGASFLPALSREKKRIETPTGGRFIKISALRWRLFSLE